MSIEGLITKVQLGLVVQLLHLHLYLISNVCIRISQDPTLGARYHMTGVTHIYSTIDILPLYIIIIVVINQLIPPLHWFNITTNCSLIRTRYVVTTRTYIAYTLTVLLD